MINYRLKQNINNICLYCFSISFVSLYLSIMILDKSIISYVVIFLLTLLMAISLIILNL